MSYELKRSYTIGDRRSYTYKEVEISIKTHDRDILIRLEDELNEIIKEMNEEAKGD